MLIENLGKQLSPLDTPSFKYVIYLFFFFYDYQNFEV